MKAGTEFEILAKEIYETLTRDREDIEVTGPKVFLQGKHGLREFDVIIKNKVADIEYLTVIECKDLTAKLNVSHIEAYAAKMTDVRANKGVMVSRSGYTQPAISMARDLGLKLLIASGRTSSEIKDFVSEEGYNIPILFVAICDLELELEGESKLTEEIIVDQTIKVQRLSESSSSIMSAIIGDTSFDATILDKPQTLKPVGNDAVRVSSIFAPTMVLENIKANIRLKKVEFFSVISINFLIQ